MRVVAFEGLGLEAASMRLMRTFFLPACLCLLVAVLGVTSFAAGNGVERGPWLEWDDLGLKYHPEVRTAIEASIETECPQMVDLFQNGDHLMVVDSHKVQTPPGVLSDSVLELTFKVESSPESEFKIRVAMDRMTGSPADTKTAAMSELSPRMRAKVIEWIGVESCFGDDFGLQNRR